MTTWGFESEREMYDYHMGKVRIREQQLESAVQEIKWALVGYIDDCISDDPQAKRDLQDAWNTLLDRLYPVQH
jgi:hypothetical protein